LQAELWESNIYGYQIKDGIKHFGCRQKYPKKYLGPWAIVRKLLIAFPLSYLVGKSFSVITNLLTEKEQIEYHKTGRSGVISNQIQP